MIRILDHTNLFGRDVSDDPDTKSRSREGLPEYKLLRQTKLQPHGTDLILKEVAKGLEYLFKGHIIRQASHIMVGLNHSRLTPKARFNHIGINGALGKEVH